MLNPVLLKMAQQKVWEQAGGPPMEKAAVVPPEGAMPPGGDPMMGGMPPGGAPPMDPAMMGGMPPGGAPPMDPAMMGGMPPPGMDPAMMGGMPPGMPPAPGMPPTDPAAAAGGVPPKMKPEQYMQMLDTRMYNMQQQMTTLMNAMDIKLDPGVLVMPPGQPTPAPEAAMQGGPQDPSQAGGAAPAGGGGGGSAIGAIDPMQAASPELAAGGGGGGAPVEKMGAAVDSFSEFIDKMASVPPESSTPAPLPGGHPGRRPATQSISAGGSKDPLSRTEAGDDLGAVNKTAQALGTPFEEGMRGHTTMQGATAVAALLRSRTAAGRQ